MYWLGLLLALQAALEGVVCVRGYRRPRLQRLVCVFCGLLLAGLLVSLCLIDWRVWVWGVPLAAYRLINLLRVYRRRLPIAQLRTVAPRAFYWLILGHAAVTATAWLVSYYQAGIVLLNVVAAAQLFCGIILLRASTHTWQHAYAPARTVTLTDKQLPTLSVLIPARNETAELEACLKLLTDSDYPKLEVLVLDDCSANRRTPEIIRSFAHAGVRFVQGQVPDETRWLAKNYAYEQLAKEASGELLLFCGVDTVVGVQSLRRLVSELESRQKDMLSIMPLRSAHSNGTALLQATRYYWEICLPRRFFKRPPVLSTCWLIRRQVLEQLGGFESVSRSVSPEASLARRTVVTDAYSFIRSDESVGIYSTKAAGEQYATSVRVRYPQLHRRLELVAVAALFEVVFLIGPLVGLLAVGSLQHAMAYAAVWGVTLVCLLVTYAIVSVGARLANPWYGWLLMPAAFVADLAMLHISLWKYEFSDVTWKGRNVCIPVMQVEPHLPRV